MPATHARWDCIIGSSGFRVGKKPAPWGMVDRSPLPCDANCLNAQKNGSARAAASRAAADLVAEPPQLLPTRDPEEPHFVGAPRANPRIPIRSLDGHESP